MRDSNVTERNAYLKVLRDHLAPDSTYLSIPAYREALEQYVRRLVSFKKVKEDAQTETRLKCISKTSLNPLPWLSPLTKLCST